MGRRTVVLIVVFLSFSALAQAGMVPIDILNEGTGTSAGDMYGSTVAVIPDLDGDGRTDIAVSAPFSDINGADCGAVFVFFDGWDGVDDISPGSADMVLYGRPSENLGMAMDVGDFNGDGLSDLLLGAPGFMDKRGRVYIFHGGNTTNRTTEEANVTLQGEWNGQRFGNSVATIGNLDGDGYDDLVVGTGLGNKVFVYSGSRHFETPIIVIPELEQDMPNPVDFSNGVNSTGNTFGLGNVTDGWDWKENIYGGSNADVHFTPLVNQGGTNTHLEVVMGNETDGGGGGGNVPSASGGFGVEFDISEEVVQAVQDGAQLRLKFTWTTRDTPQAGIGGLDAWQGEVYWVKSRFWNSTANATYLGRNYDGDNNPSNDEDVAATTDATNELFYMNWAGGAFNVDVHSSMEDIDVSHYIDGAHGYYFDIGGKLSDWSVLGECLEIWVDDVSLVVEYEPVAEILGPIPDSDFGAMVARAGDVNRDGYDDVLVGAPGASVVNIYFGGPDFMDDFQVYYDWALPATQGDTDTTQEPNTNDLRYEDGQPMQDQNNYIVDRNQRMDIETWSHNIPKGLVVAAYLYMGYSASFNYNGNNWVRWALEGDDYQQTDLHPVPTMGATNYNDANGPYPLHQHGVRTLDDIRNLDLEFTNNDQGGGGGGGHTVFFNYAQILVIAQMPSNVTIQGPEDSDLGTSLAALGDINKDGNADIVVGAPGADGGRGAVFVFGGGETLVGDVTYEDAMASVQGSAPAQGLGGTVSSAGLFSLDDIPDIAIGAPRKDNGTIYVIRGGPNIRSGKVDEVAHYVMVGEMDGSRLPSDIAALGDINGGHGGELLVGAAGHRDGPGEPSGKAYILYNTDEDLLDGPFILDHYPKGDVIMDEGGSQLFGVVLRAPDELDMSIEWDLDDKMVSVNVLEYTYRPDFRSSGDHVVTVNVSDGFRTAEIGWDVQVLNVNAAPVVVFHPSYDPRMDEGGSFRFWVEAWDPDDDPLSYTWTLDGDPMLEKGPSLVVETGHDQAGTYIINVSVSDGELALDHHWHLTVDDVNGPPVIDTVFPETSPTVREGDEQVFRITAHDPDGDDLVMVWTVDGVIYGSDALNLLFEPGPGTVGEHEVTVKVSDGLHVVGHTWVVTVVKGNLPPVIASADPESPVLIDEGDDVLFMISAFDPDGDELTFAWYLDGKKARGETTFDFQCPPNPRAVYTLEVLVDDGELNTSARWDIHVNRGPVIDRYNPNSGSRISPGQTIGAWVRMTDLDDDDLTVTWYIDGDIASHERFSGTASGKRSNFDISGPYGRSGVFVVRVVVSDGRLDDDETWTFDQTVGTDTPPTALITYDPKAPKRGASVRFDGSGSTDPEADIVTYAWAFSDGSTSERADTTFIFDEKGIYTVTLTVTDSKGNSGTTTEVIVIKGYMKSDEVESPWGMLLFILLLMILMMMVLYQAKRKGWLPAVAMGRRGVGEKVARADDDLAEDDEVTDEEVEEEIEREMMEEDVGSVDMDDIDGDLEREVEDLDMVEDMGHPEEDMDGGEVMEGFEEIPLEDEDGP